MKLAYFAPNLVLNGVYRWISDLAANTDRSRVCWTGGLIYGNGSADVDCVRSLSRLMPLHCGDPSHWGLVWHTREALRIHNTLEEAAAAAAEGADAILTWESDSIFERLRFLGLPVILVSHSTWWAPDAIRRQDSSHPLAATHLTAVSEAASRPFRRSGLSVSVIHSGVSLDRCVSTHSRESVRAGWRVGPSHKVLLSVGRHHDHKNLETVGRLAAELGPTYKAVICGGNEQRQLSDKIRALASGSNGQIIALQPQDRLGDLYQACDLLVCDSLYESFGQTLAEAWAAGLPTLCREGLGAVPELERKFGPLAYKYPSDASIADIAAFAGRILQERPEPEIVERARQVAQSYLSAGAMAVRWEDYLCSLGLNRAPVLTSPREVRVRWRDKQRPIRVLLYCRRLDRQLLDQVLAIPGTVCVAAVVTEEVACQPPHTPVVTDISGPEWAERHQDLRDGFRQYANQADLVLVNDLPYAASSLSLTNLPALGWTRPFDRYSGWEKLAVSVLSGYADHERELPQAIGRLTTVPEVSLDSFKAFMICPHIGFGGTEKWMEGLFARQAGITWVGCGSVSREVFNDRLCRKFVEDCDIPISIGSDIPAAVAAAKPDVVVFWGVDQAGRFFPATFRGPVVSVSHGTQYCNWTRRWLSSSASFATHHAAISFSAVSAYPQQFQAGVEVVYPGVEPPAVGRSREQIRAGFGFDVCDRVLAYVGRSDPAKNPLLPADLVAALPCHYKLLHIGDTGEWPGDFAQELRDRLPGRHVAIGHTDAVHELLTAADMLILRSTSESFGLVLLEALQAGCDVLTSDRTILGELATDPAWQGMGLVLPSAASPQQLAEAVETRFEGRQRPDGRCRELIQSRFSVELAAGNFRDYLRHVVDSTESAGGTPLFAVSDRNPTPIGHEADSHVICDAVLVLSEDPRANETAVESLLVQRQATVFVHALGSTDACSRLRHRFEGDWRLLTEEGEPRPVLDWACSLALRKLLRSEYVLFVMPDSRSLPERASVTVGYMQSAGLELFVAGGNPLAYDSLALRAGTLIDLALCGGSFRGVGDLFQKAKSANRLRHIHHKPLAFGGDAGEFCRRLPIVTCSAPPVDMVLPFHDQLEYVREAVESVLTQEGLDVVLHLIDGGSSDQAGAGELLKRYAGRHDRVAVRTYRADAGAGQFMTVNAVEQYLETDYILIQDGDDVSDPQRARISALSLELSGAGLFSSAVRLFGGGPRTLLSSYPFDGCRYYMINPASAIRCSEFVRLGGYFDFGGAARNRCSLDTDFFLRAFASGVRCQVSSLSLVSYRQHAASAVVNNETGFRSTARQYVERELVKHARLLPAVRGSLEACRGLLEVIA